MSVDATRDLDSIGPVEVLPEFARGARRTVCALAEDADDARLLLDMLGLLEEID